MDCTSLLNIYLQPPIIMDLFLVICRRRQSRKAENRQMLNYQGQEEEDKNYENSESGNYK